ncbi:hypothetical protein BUALT_Bualt11G0118500 [Buddleja alternifolia]|uniref:Uncharacterized protein n=1 Tax=Buddleja alternifolia TaxID=168488 RepID=A0AAV6X1L6_9LAMI|nr:hypothetical protein BUALT_Bualt11G0118500 [Buddleja alternifolia]
MRFTFLNSLLQKLSDPKCAVLLYAAAWTAILTAAVVMASFSSEMAFLYTISETSSMSPACRNADSVRLPLDIPSEDLCFPDGVFKRSRIDAIVPPLFATVMVVASTSMVKALGLWEDENEQRW